MPAAGLLFILLAIAAFTFGVVATCPEHCTCSAVVVRCEGPKLTKVPLLPTNTIYLYFTNCSVTQLDSNSFRGLEKLQLMNMQGCLLEQIGQDVFSTNTQLVSSYLNFNKIRNIDPKAFRGPTFNLLSIENNYITTLEFLKHTRADKLYLGMNPLRDVDFSPYPSLLSTTGLALTDTKLTSISARKFSNLNNLTMLHMHKNLISHVDGETFSHMTKLGQVFLQNNRIRSLPNNLLSFFNRTRQLNIGENPYHCNCKLRWFKEWLIQSGRFYGYCPCATPFELSGKNIMNLSPLDFVCKPLTIVRVADPVVSVPEGGTITLECVVSGDPVADVQWISRLGVGSQRQIKDFARAESTSVLTLKNVKGEHTGEYVCVGENEDEAVESRTWVLITSG